jgi:predicted enzyme related to lactoylglutathione lyase
MTTSKMDDPAFGDYTLFLVNGEMVGGSVAPQMPGVPNHWHVYFAVSGADAAVAKAAELGGSVLAEPFDTPVGRMAVLSDPQGAAFSSLAAHPGQGFRHHVAPATPGPGVAGQEARAASQRGRPGSRQAAAIPRSGARCPCCSRAYRRNVRSGPCGRTGGHQ